MYVLRFLHIFNGLTMKLKVSKLYTPTAITNNSKTKSRF